MTLTTHIHINNVEDDLYISRPGSPYVVMSRVIRLVFTISLVNIDRPFKNSITASFIYRYYGNIVHARRLLYGQTKHY